MCPYVSTCVCLLPLAQAKTSSRVCAFLKNGQVLQIWYHSRCAFLLCSLLKLMAKQSSPGAALGSCGVSSSHSHSASNRSSPGSASYRSPETCTSSRSRSSVASYRSPRRSSAACHGATPFQGLPADARTTNGSRL